MNEPAMTLFPPVNACQGLQIGGYSRDSNYD